MVDICLADAIRSVGPPPSALFKGCYLIKRDPIIFFNFLMLLVLELGQNNFTARAAACSLDPMAAIVILTVKRGFGDCMSTSPLIVPSRYSISAP